MFDELKAYLEERISAYHVNFLSNKNIGDLALMELKGARDVAVFSLRALKEIESQMPS